MIALDRLSLNTATVKRLKLAEAADLCARHGVGGIGLWRDRVQEVGSERAAAIVADAGLHVSSLCRGGFFTPDASQRAEMLDDNRLAIEEAATVGADVLVLVCGGLQPGSRDLPAARDLIAAAITELAPFAQEAGVRLGIEPMHPMFCADRSAITRLRDALDLARQFPVETVGVVVDSYHVWWDGSVLADIADAGDRVASFQVCDWVVPLPADMLLGRGHIGDGSIDFAPLAAAVEATGYQGMVEVEIFNQDIWDAPGDETITTVKSRFATHLG
jgi:sugar phosphate isomerase/epimerase